MLQLCSSSKISCWAEILGKQSRHRVAIQDFLRTWRKVHVIQEATVSDEEMFLALMPQLIKLYKYYVGASNICLVEPGDTQLIKDPPFVTT